MDPVQQAIALFRSHEALLEEKGVSWAQGARPQAYVPGEMTAGGFRPNYRLAMDAVANIPTLSTDPNSAVPAMLTTLIDPKVYEVLFAPNAAVEILGEERRGTWVDQTTMFPVAEATGEISSYGDYNNSGRAGVNTNWPQVQAYLFQVIKEYGELELERAGLARINWVSQIDRAAAIALNKFSNFAYFFGVGALQNYGLLNNPFLSASLTPAPKAAGGTAWLNASNQVVATANEVYNDIQSLVTQLVLQNAGLVTPDSPMKLCLGPVSSMGLTAVNSFNVNVRTLLANNFPNIKINARAVQYEQKSPTNPQGIAAGNLMQLIAEEVEGQQTAFCAFNEKMRAQTIVRELSAWKQKMLGGVWGTVMRYPAGIASMIGI